jgi:hypothetical protein
MRHPTEGTLRQLVDEPAGVADTDREHVAGCSKCLDGLAAAREDASVVAAALATEVDVDVDAAWRRFSTTAPAAQPTTTTPRPRRSRTLLRRPVVATLAAAAVLGGAGVAAAGGWIEIFQTEQIAPVSINTAELVAVPDLDAYGSLLVTREPDVHQVPDAAAAGAETGLDVPHVTTLPRGVSGEPAYQVGGRVTAVFTFSADRAARAAGGALPPPPPALDGSRVRLVAGPLVAQIWSQRSGAPALVVGRAVAPKAFSSGVPFETVRDYLLSLPGVPDDVAAQLRTFNADGSTLPLPVPSRRFTTSPEQVNGVPATVLAARDRTMAAVVWVQDGVVTAVAGSLDADEVLSVARELR